MKTHNEQKVKILRITTVPVSLRELLLGQHKFMTAQGFDIIGVSSSGEALDDVSENEGIRTVAIEMSRKITPFKDLISLYRLIQLFRKEEPEIVHTHTPKAGLLGMIAGFVAGVPLRLHTVAGMPLTVAKGTKRQLLNLIERLTYACATHVYPNSYGLEKIILEKRFTKASKLKVIGNGSSNGIDTAKFDPDVVDQQNKDKIRAELGIREDDFIYLFVGRVVSDKGVNELVQAFCDIQEVNPNSHLVLVGPYENHLDPLLPETEKKIVIHPHIHAVGYKANVRDYYATADVLTFPSYREGFPNVVMQAAAMQLNCIVSNINGCNEIISNGKNGWVIPVKNVEELKNRMLWCYNNREASKAMGLHGRRLIKKKYEQTFVWEELLKEYRSLLNATSANV